MTLVLACGVTCALGWPSLAIGQQSTEDPAEVPAEAPSPASGPIPLREAFVDADGDGVPDRLGDRVVVEGVITSDPRVLGRAAALVPFQDGTAGAPLFSRDTTLVRPLRAGDSIRVRGRVAQYRGAEQLVLEDYRHFGRVPVPAPRDVFARDLHTERYSGRLVRVDGVLRTTLTGTDQLEVFLEDRTGSVPVQLTPRLLADPDFVEGMRRGGGVSVVGVANQVASADPPVGGYRLIPRGPADFEFSPAPDYSLLALGAAGAMIIALLLWRRATARRAQELEELADELRSSREELGIREARYRSLVENARDTVSIVDADGTVLYHGASVTRMLGWLPEELEGRPIFEHVHPEDLARVAELFRGDPLEPNSYREVELRFRATDGSWHDLEVVATNRLHDPAVQGIVCNVRDVTRARALETRLRQADRLETVGRLAGGIAHDFNNILTAVRGHADMALEDMAEDAEGRAEVVEIVRNTDRASAVTRQLLAFTRQQVRETQSVSACATVQSMLPTLRRLIGGGVEINVALCDAPDTIEVDAGQIEQVLLNLVINARDATSDGGRITLQVAEDEITADMAAQYPYDVQPGHYVRISVADTGDGMEEEVLSRVFEPFFTTKDAGEGTGLGLATVYGIVKQSGGYIWARSDPGAGTRFDAFFPQVAAPEEDSGVTSPEPAPPETAPAAPETAAETAAVSGSEKVILLVEDESAVRRLAARVLRKNRYEVLEASRGSEALDLLEEHEHVDLLLTDVVMPGMSGIKLAERVMERLPKLPVLLMSGYTADEVVEGTDGARLPLMEKPFTPRQLLEQVGECLRRDTVASSNGG